MKRVLFFLILLVKRPKLLVHDWFSSCLATANAIKKLLLKSFCIKELKDKSENENTKKSMECWKNVFKKKVNERNFKCGRPKEPCPQPTLLQ